jgi:hypothetical protein
MLLAIWRTRRATLTPYKQEFFGSFFCEKELLAFFCLPHQRGGSVKRHSHRNLVSARVKAFWSFSSKTDCWLPMGHNQGRLA